MKHSGIYFATLLFSFFSSTLLSQSLYEKELSGIGNLAISDVYTAPDGSRYLAGSVNPATVDSVMAVLIKTDSLSNILWAKRYKCFHKDLFTSITPLSDGNLILGGTIRENFNPLSGGSIYKIDTTGNEMWHKVYSDSYDDRVLKVFERPDNSLMLFIQYGVSGQPTKLIHTDNSGNIISQRVYEMNTQGIAATSVTADASHNYYMSGTLFNSSAGHSNLFICAVNESVILWIREYDFGRNADSYGITYTTDGNLAVNGSIPDTLFPSSYNTWILKTDLSGTVLWANEYGQTQAYNETLTGITPLPNGDILSTGQANTVAGSDALAFTVSASGNVLWTQTYHHFPYQYLYKGNVLPDGTLLLTGSSLSTAYLLRTTGQGLSGCSSTSRVFVSTPVPVTVAQLVVNDPGVTVTASTPGLTVTTPNLTINQICASSVGIDESPEQFLNIYPVPSNDQLFIQSTLRIKKFEVTDITGRVIYSAEPAGYYYNFSVNRFRDGVYFLTADFDLQKQTFKILVQHSH